MKRIITRYLFCLSAAFIVAAPLSAAGLVTPVPVASAAPTADEKATRDALKEFKSLSRKDKKGRIKEAKKAWKEYKAAKKAGKDTDDRTILLVILAILLPPLAVYLHQNEINSKFWISLVLTLLFWIPGVIYALLVIFDAV